MFDRKIIFLIAMIVVAFFIGANLNKVENEVTQYTNISFDPVSTAGFVPVQVAINESTVYLYDDCYSVSFNITEDQAYSVARGMAGLIGARPLTHDIMKDILDDYNIKITNIMIDRYENEIYYATIYFRQGNRILELDSRPSDAIAMSVRTGIPVYFKQSILQDQGENTCQNP